MSSVLEQAGSLTRRNALFAGHEVGAENWSLLASIVATCKLDGINPVTYIAGTLEAILNGHPPELHRRPDALALSGPVKPHRIGDR